MQGFISTFYLDYLGVVVFHLRYLDNLMVLSWQ